jgi:DNA-binding response OmpR family regulator
MKILVYSHDANTRTQVRLAIGRRPAPGLPKVEFVEVATEPAVFVQLDKGDIDVVILDGEAQPAGGMGICRQAKDEIYRCPPIMVLIARRDDGWLATWSRADAVASQPIDAVELAEGVAGLMRLRAAEIDGGTGHSLSLQ